MLLTKEDLGLAILQLIRYLVLLLLDLKLVLAEETDFTDAPEISRAHSTRLQIGTA